MMRVRTLLLACAMVVSAFVATAFALDGYTLTVKDADPPAEVSKDLRDRMTAKSLVVADGDGPMFAFWFATEIEGTVKGAKAQETLEKITEIGLLGIVEVLRDDLIDFRDDPFDPGIYTMRLGLQPQDGDHMGTAPFDTFAILLSHKLEEELFKYGGPDHEFLEELSSEDTVAEHPPILSLQPMSSDEGEFPRLDEGGDDWKFLCIKLPVKIAGEIVHVPVQVVIEGIGDI